MPRIRTTLAASAAVTALVATACASQPQSTPGASASPAPDCTVNSPGLHKNGRLTVATDSPAYEPWFDSNTASNGKGF
ncbi:hypothetical protein ACFUGD_10680 [Streptomyces sp. NPDC057217]|uniref:hypothetical protein n=1 Tax=unclassified Streptomyces TaxID=2593676 RepID=UPI0036264338